MVKNKDRWSALSMKDRADLIKLYVGNGITSLDAIKKDYNSFGPGGYIERDKYGYPADITPAVVTQDSEFNKFLITLPDNQRLTPEEEYHTYQYWKINGKPKDFSEALNLEMYHYDSSDSSYHANSVAFDDKGVGHFMKPKHHPTVKYELDWYNKGISTLEGGEQYPLQGEERKEWEDFRKEYRLDSTGVDYKYVPRKHYNSFDEGGTIEPLYYDDTYIEPAVVKAFDSNEDYNRYYGEQFGKQVAKKRDKVANNIMRALEYTPFVGDGIDVANSIASINKGDYSQAAVLAGLTLLPNAIESIGKVVTRPFKNARRLKRMKETYTGVRHIPDRNNPHITMDDNFPTYNGTIWSSETPEYARQWVYDTEGKVYKVLTDPSELKMVETPVPNSGEYYPWNSLPYELKDGNLSSRPSILVDSHILPDIETAVKYKRGTEYGELSEKEIRELETNFLKGRANSGTDITTDNIVEQSYIQGFDGVNFKGVYDGPSIKDGLIIDVPINETVLNPHVPHIVLPENKSKWSLLFKDLDDLTIKKFGGKL